MVYSPMFTLFLCQRLRPAAKQPHRRVRPLPQTHQMNLHPQPSLDLRLARAEHTLPPPPVSAVKASPRSRYNGPAYTFGRETEPSAMPIQATTHIWHNGEL